ncbi:hypothetical protein NDU88_000928 [Pleurodeles waltl]|uniref:Uncharacterized protein n=1 Tax=Pleurodeles waltl TaxID=8319 RepID=A0AAV7VZX8_PLEWA|nr:hypothetical protein NDU88_000928 [Pleurodeles waltl]
MRHSRRPPRRACKRYSSGLRFPSSVKSFRPSHTPPAGEEAGEASQPQFRSHRRDGHRCSSTEPRATAPLLSTGPPAELQLVVKKVSRASLPSTAVPRDRSVVPPGSDPLSRPGHGVIRQRSTPALRSPARVRARSTPEPPRQASAQSLHGGGLLLTEGSGGSSPPPRQPAAPAVLQGLEQLPAAMPSLLQ